MANSLSFRTFTVGQRLSHPPLQNGERKMKNTERIRRKQRNKIKRMITEQNAEPHVAAAALRPDSDPSIENQNGTTSSVSKMENVNGALLLDELESLLTRFVILPTFAPETLALWILHTYAFEL